MILGASALPFRKAVITPTKLPALSVPRIGCRTAPGAIAKMFADSPVPCPMGSLLNSSRAPRREVSLPCIRWP